MHIAFLDSLDPQENAATEEFFFRKRPFPEDEATLLFYTNRECVQYGRNQDPAAECALAWCQENGIPVLRRNSGGGTVYHDQGNQNYAFILPRKWYSPEAVLNLVVQALQQIGVRDARFCERYSIWHGENKISGSAFALSGPAAMLHGCLPFTTDLTRLHQALTPDAPHSGHRRFVRSVVSPVANITTLASSPETCRQEFCQRLSVLAEEWFSTHN